MRVWTGWWIMGASIDLVHKVCKRCGTTAGLTRMEVAAGYKCLRCGGFFEDFVSLQGTEKDESVGTT